MYYVLIHKGGDGFTTTNFDDAMYCLTKGYELIGYAETYLKSLDIVLSIYKQEDEDFTIDDITDWRLES